MEKYSDRPMDFADASLKTASEIYEINAIITIDSDFLFYKNKKNKLISILNAEMIKTSKNK
jgi:predicted nucleic acid-binding protein